ncbi:MAG: hypothetical protein IPO83_03895 [Chitinophagaceae bacterium]|nr:hypothetical protein [Chitinophagaceae bacterium]
MKLILSGTDSMPEQNFKRRVRSFEHMKTLSENNTKKFKEIIDLLSEKKVEKLYFLIGPEKFSFAALRHFIRDEKIKNAIKDGLPRQKIATTYGVSKMTVYRHLKNGKKKK